MSNMSKGEPEFKTILAGSPAQIAQLKKSLLEECEAAIDARLTEPPENRALTIDENEEIACEVRDEVSKTLGEEIVKETSRACDKVRHSQKHPCQECSRMARRREEKARTIVTMAGEVRLNRRIYYCARCDRCTTPLDQKMRLPEHDYSRQVEQEVARSCVKEAFEKGVRDLRRLARVSVSATEAQRITLTVGEYAQKATQQDVAKAFIDPENRCEQKHDPTITLYVFLL